MSQLPFDWKPDRTDQGGDAGDPDPITVGALGKWIGRALEAGLPDPLRVVGEVGTFSSRSGHWYFSLRDADARVSCVMWAADSRRCRLNLEVGDQVIATGSVVHWPPQGRTQFRVRHLDSVGEGVLQAAFRKLCVELRALGWFDPAIKTALPRVPRRVAVLTSASGAAIHDVRATAARRFPRCGLVLVDVPVQGAGAAEVIAERLREVDEMAGRDDIDAIVLTRGGGSAEDLQAFNDRVLAQAIHDVRTPVVAAIGHESDTTIAELVADQRASTPTATMVLLLPNRDDELQRIDLLARALHGRMDRRRQHALYGVAHDAERLGHAMTRRVGRSRARADGLGQALAHRQPRAVLVARSALVERLGVGLGASMDGLLVRCVPDAPDRRLGGAMVALVDRVMARVARLEGVLDAVGPDAVLARGYTITTDGRGRVVRASGDVGPGDRLTTRTADGTIPSVVEASP